MTVGTSIVLLGKHSGAHINPAVTVACSVSRRMPRSLLVPYVFFQIIGGLLAGLTLRRAFGSSDSITKLGSTQLAPSISPLIGTALETIGTLTLVLVILVTASRTRSAKINGFIIGTTLFILILLIGPFTGASFNPARSLGPSIASGYLTNQLVYWIGPLSGGLIGASLFNMIQGNADRKPGDEKHPLCLC